MKHILLCLAVAVSAASALYDSKDDVIQLTASNFQNRVINGDEIWIVEFFAPWCGHCKNLAPEYKKAATALKGIVKVGAVDMTEHQSVGAPYNVQGFPTIKIFGANKQKPTDFQGARTAQGIADAAINELKKTINARLSGKAGGTGGGAGGDEKRQRGTGKEVIELTDSNFEDLVLNSKDIWMVEFFAPWCGHCKNLEPHWKQAAAELKGKVKLGALDATANQMMASKFGIKGFPTIKYFAPGSSAEDAVDYDGGRTSSDIVSWAMSKVSENVPPPEVLEAVSDKVVEEACKDKQLCIVAVLPHILDCQSKCRNEYIGILKELSEKFKRNMWGWLWTEAAKQPKLEEAFEIGGFGYPAMAAANYRKMKFSMLKGSFSTDGIHEFLRDLSYGKGQTIPIKGVEFPKISTVEPWDGKDGEMPVDEDIDLSDVDLDDIDTAKPTKEKSEL